MALEPGITDGTTAPRVARTGPQAEVAVLFPVYH